MKIIAHRGASGEFPENSLLAFEQAIAQQADGIELDVHYHQASAQFIVIHDIYLDASTNGHGDLNQYSLEQLSQLSLGQEQHLLTLDIALKHIAGRMPVNIEFKSCEDKTSLLKEQLFALKAVIDKAMLEDNYRAEHFILSSFNHTLVLLSKTILTDIATGALIAHCPIDNAQVVEATGASYLNLDIDCLNASLVQDAHQRGAKVWVYTVDRKEQIQRCQQLGVDGIFTNYPKSSRKLSLLAKHQ